jgi:hypothetical protein
MFGLAPEWFALMGILGFIAGTIGGKAPMVGVSPMLAVPVAIVAFGVLMIGGRSPLGIVASDAKQARPALLASAIGSLIIVVLIFRSLIFHEF